MALPIVALRAAITAKAITAKVVPAVVGTAVKTGAPLALLNTLLNTAGTAVEFVAEAGTGGGGKNPSATPRELV